MNIRSTYTYTHMYVLLCVLLGETLQFEFVPASSNLGKPKNPRNSRDTEHPTKDLDWTTCKPWTPMKTREPESLTLKMYCSQFFPLFYGISQAKSALPMSPPTVEKDKSIPSFATANAAAETAYRAAAAAAERLRSEDEGGSKPATNATSASWAQRPSSKAGTGTTTKPSPKVHPERDGFNAGRARRSSPVNEGGRSAIF